MIRFVLGGIIGFIIAWLKLGESYRVFLYQKKYEAYSQIYEAAAQVFEYGIRGYNNEEAYEKDFQKHKDDLAAIVLKNEIIISKEVKKMAGAFYGWEIKEIRKELVSFTNLMIPLNEAIRNDLDVKIIHDFTTILLHPKRELAKLLRKSRQRDK